MPSSPRSGLKLAFLGQKEMLKVPKFPQLHTVEISSESLFRMEMAAEVNTGEGKRLTELYKPCNRLTSP